jgi:nucleoside-diphosphate-sugar epimerase
MSTVLVTGASGFIGLPVATALVAQGHRVVGLDLVAPATPAQGVQHVLGGLSDVHLIYRLLEQWGVDTIVHGGAISGPMLARDNPYLVCETNVVGTINLMEASRQRGLRRMVQLSSAAAFGATPPAPVADDAPLRAKDLYGASKGAADLLLEAYRRQYGLDVIALRIANAYGPGRRTRCAVRSMVANALAGRPTHFDWGADQARPYLYIDDTVAAVLAAVRAERAPQFAYNIAGAEFVPMPRVAAAVQAAIPGAVISFQPGLDGLGYQREALDLRAAARDLGFRPSVSIETGVRRYVDWMRAQPCVSHGSEEADRAAR